MIASHSKSTAYRIVRLDLPYPLAAPSTLAYPRDDDKHRWLRSQAISWDRPMTQVCVCKQEVASPSVRAMKPTPWFTVHSNWPIVIIINHHHLSL